MEAVTLDINTVEVKNSKEVPEAKKEDDEGNSFLSILRRMTARSETESLDAELEPTIEDTPNPKFSKQTILAIGDKPEPVSQDKQNLAQINLKEKPMTDLEANFDEEIQIREMLAQMENAEPVSISAILEQGNFGLDDKLPASHVAERPKSLLQSLMEQDASKLNDDLLSELVQQAEKGMREPREPKIKKFDALASVRINKNADEKQPKTNGESTELSTKKLLKKISVEDYRRSANSNTEALSFGTHQSGSEERVSTESFSPKELTIELPAITSETVYTQVDSAQSLVADEANSASETTAFSQVLAQQLANASEDIVQAGKIILRDNNEGVIRLQLQPAQLGRVRIELQMREGKKLSGKILVESKETLSAFEESMQELIAEFEKNGFDTAGFQLSLSYPETPQRQFNESQMFFGFSDSYEDDLVLRSNAELSENIIGFGQAETVNVLA